MDSADVGFVMTPPTWYCWTISRWPAAFVTQLPFLHLPVTWACCVSQGYGEGRTGSGWENTLEMVKGHVQSSSAMGPIISRHLSDIGPPPLSVTISLCSPTCPALLCVPDKRQDKGLPASRLPPAVGPSHPQLRIGSHSHHPGCTLEPLR